MIEDKDQLGSRMKDQYESRTQSHIPRRTTTVIRIDGKAFHSYTRGLNRPFDEDLMADMDETAIRLCAQIQGAKMAYVQSDEISIILTDFDEITTQAWFDGNVQKMTSISASIAAAEFNSLRIKRLLLRFDHSRYIIEQETSDSIKNAYFDSRVFSIPDPTEVENYLIWRQNDATRNSIQMAAQSMFSHKELQGVNTTQLQEKMWSEKGVNWNNYPDGFKRGRCVVKTHYEFSGITRSKWVTGSAPIFTKDRSFIKNYIPRL